MRSQIYDSELMAPIRLGVAILIAIAAIGVSIQASASQSDVEFDLSDYGGKVVMIDFWASWCGPCRQSFPWMNDMHTKYRDNGLVVVAVNVDNDPDAAMRFLDDYPVGFKVHFDEDKSLARKYDVTAMPSSFLIDRDGQVIEQRLGFKVAEQDQYEAVIRSVLELER